MPQGIPADRHPIDLERFRRAVEEDGLTLAVLAKRFGISDHRAYKLRKKISPGWKAKAGPR